MSFPTLIFITSAFFVRMINGDCRGSYSVVSDNMDDVRTNDNHKNWLDICVGSEDVIQRERSLTADFIIELRNARFLTIVGLLRSIDTNTSRLFRGDLEYLILRLNTLRTIPTKAFNDVYYLSNLRVLHLESNNIEYVRERLFGDSIEIVNLSANNISSIEGNTFVESKIKILYLEQNVIYYVEPGAFPATLRKLYLGHNKIEFLHDQVFSTVDKLELLSVKNNRLTSLSSAVNLHNLRVFDSSFNNLQHIRNELDKMVLIELINLSHNQLRQINVSNIIANKKNLVIKVILAFNHLSTLQLESIKTGFLRPGPILILYGNPWNCDCLQQVEREMVARNFIRSDCDRKLFKDGRRAICITPKAPVENQDKCLKSNVDAEAVDSFIKLMNQFDSDTECDLLTTEQNFPFSPLRPGGN